MKYILICLVSLWTISTYAYTGNAEKGDRSDLGKEFKIYTNNVEVNAIMARSLQMETIHNEYQLKLVPLSKGKVCFTLTDIRFRTTVKVPELLFRIEVKGYLNGEQVSPIFNVDRANQQTFIQGNKLYFREIYGGIPVWFNESVDSVKIIYSNSHGLDLPQYILLADLHLMPDFKSVKNPIPALTTTGDSISFLIALDASSSMDKREKRKMHRYFMHFMDEVSPSEADTLASITFLNYGTEIYGEYNFQSKRDFRRAFRKIRRKDIPASQTRYTNWSAPLNRALEEKPDVFIMVTDGWSNYYAGKPTILTRHFASLVHLCNKIKENGTRIIFVTTGFMQKNQPESLLTFLLDGENTRIVQGKDIDKPIYSQETDLIALSSFKELKEVKMLALFQKEEAQYVASREVQ